MSILLLINYQNKTCLAELFDYGHTIRKAIVMIATYVVYFYFINKYNYLIGQIIMSSHYLFQ